MTATSSPTTSDAPAAYDIADLVWHGARLCRALHRAWEAEQEAETLRARVAELEGRLRDRDR